MANKILIQEIDGAPKQMVFGDHAGDFGPAAANDLRKTTDGTQETDVALTLASLADGSARQSAKFDLGEHRSAAYALRAAFELAATPVAGDLIELYLGWSPDSTAANANPGNLSGSDAAYSGYASNLADSVRHLDGPYLFVCTANATGTVQIAEVALIVPKERYGVLVIKNEAGAAFHSDDVESHAVLDPIVEEIQ